MKYRITLDIDTNSGNPENWDWMTLTDEDSCEVVECTSIDPMNDLLVALGGMVGDWERVHGEIPEDHEAKVILKKFGYLD